MRFFFQFWRLEIATLQKYICEVDEERSGNVDIVVELIHCLIDCSLMHAYKKLISAGWGLLIWGGDPLSSGGTKLKGGKHSKYPKKPTTMHA